MIGFGCNNYKVAFFIEHKPNMAEYRSLDDITALTQGEIAQIGVNCGNGWRKIFNVYAKFMFALEDKTLGLTNGYSRWQDYRDNQLLQVASQTALLFSPPMDTQNQIKIIAGRTYAKKLINEQSISANLLWINDEFAVDEQRKIIVSPFLDYRQLSNVKIATLCQLTKPLLTSLVN